MAGLSAVAVTSGVGAGVSQGRIQSTIQPSRPTERKSAAEDVKTAALQLIRSAVTAKSSGATRHDLDVLA